MTGPAPVPPPGGEARPEQRPSLTLTGNDDGERLVADLQATIGCALARLEDVARDVSHDVSPRLARRLAALVEEAEAAQRALTEAMARLARGVGAAAAIAADGGAAHRPVRVLVVDEHPVVRRGIAAAAAAHPDVTLAGEAHSVEGALSIAERARADVVLLDYRLPDMCAPEAAPRLRDAMPGARLVLFTTDPGKPARDAALRAGFDGWILKDSPMSAIFDALRRIAAGERVVDPRLPGGPQSAQKPPAATPPLTRREYEVLRRVAMGETNEEIARAIGLSRNTVKTYLQAALGKLGARNRVEALARAAEAGLL